MSIARSISRSIARDLGRGIGDGLGGSANPYGDDFVMLVATTAPAETFTLPCANFGTYNAIIDWGDGSTSTITTYNDADLAHEYASAGDHEIRISGALPSIRFNNGGDKLKVKEIRNWGDVGFVALYAAFFGCSNLTSVTSYTADTSSVTNMSYMFRACSGLTSLDVSGFDTSSVTNMSGMFNGCSSLGVVSISGWNVASATNGTNFMSGANLALDTTEYEALLVAWEGQAVQNTVTWHFGDATYSSPSAAATAKAALIADHSWVITDGGAA